MYVYICIYIYICMYIYVYVYIVGGKRQLNYKFIPTDLFRGCPLITGFNVNNLYHRLNELVSPCCHRNKALLRNNSTVKF